MGLRPTAVYQEIGAVCHARQLFDLSIRGHLGGLGLQAWLIKEPTDHEIPREALGLFAKSRWLVQTKRQLIIDH